MSDFKMEGDSHVDELRFRQSELHKLDAVQSMRIDYFYP